MLISGLILLFGLIIVLLFYVRYKYRLCKLKNYNSRKEKKIKYGIFEPFCCFGGGSDKVLCSMIDSILRDPNSEVYIYHSRISDKSILYDYAEKTFSIKLSMERIHFVPLKYCRYLGFECYPFMTLLCRDIASVFISIYALTKLKPDIYISTMGYSFTFPIFKIFGRSTVISYVHFPIVTTDMVSYFCTSSEHKNKKTVYKPGLSNLRKQFYLYTMAVLYYYCNKFTDVVMVNSLWTYSHIKNIWGIKCISKDEEYSLNNHGVEVSSGYFSNTKVYLAYPPCVDKIPNDDNLEESEVEQETEASDSRSVRKPYILSFGQFRIEKDQKLQLIIFKKLLKIFEHTELGKNLKLVMIGNCLNNDSYTILEDLKNTAVELDITDQVEFVTNASLETIQSYLKSCLIGLHTMKSEHFGISVVEMAAYGLIVVAHKSGGPLLDIIKNHYMDDNSFDNVSGFLASSPEEYVSYIEKILTFEPEILSLIRSNSVKCTKYRFTNKAFSERISEILKPIILHQILN